LLIEEFSRSLIELNLLETKDQTGGVVGSMSGESIPSTIKDAIMARVNSLPRNAKALLDAGSVIGREFSHRLLLHVTGLPNHELVPRLSILRYSGLLDEKGVYPETVYVFRHGLIQEACYYSLADGTRQLYHRATALAIRKHFAEAVKETPEVLAHHFDRAGLVEEAIQYQHMAGSAAMRRSANSEAIRHLTKAMKMLEILPDLQRYRRQEFDLQLALGQVWMATKGYTSPEAEQAYARARELCDQIGEVPERFSMLRGLWGFHIVRAEVRRALEIAEECLAIARDSEDSAFLVWAHFQVGMNLFVVGEFASAGEHFDQSMAIYDARKRTYQRTLQDPRVACLSFRAIVLWLLGYPNQASEASRHALSVAESLAHPFTTAYALGLGVAFFQLCGRVHEAGDTAEALNALCAEDPFPYWDAWGTVVGGWALTYQEPSEEGIARVEQGLTAYRKTGAELAQPYFLWLLAQALGKRGQADKGLVVVSEALARVNKTEERWYEAELYRIQGELLSANPSPEYNQAEASLVHALEIARRQNAKWLELRAVISLSRFWENRNRKQEARDLLARIYSWFSEGLNTPDLQQARELLDRLA
jgi:predicted ATPase